MTKVEALDRERIRDLLSELGKMLGDDGISGQVHLVGGGVVALA